MERASEYHKDMTQTLTTAEAADTFIADNWSDSMVLTVAEMLDVEATLAIHSWEVRISCEWGQTYAASYAGPAEYGCDGFYEVFNEAGKSIDSGSFGFDGPENLSLAWLVKKG